MRRAVDLSTSTTNRKLNQHSFDERFGNAGDSPTVMFAIDDAKDGGAVGGASDGFVVGLRIAEFRSALHNSSRWRRRQVEGRTDLPRAAR